VGALSNIYGKLHLAFTTTGDCSAVVDAKCNSYLYDIKIYGIAKNQASEIY
jgi:hypothetical protein